LAYVHGIAVGAGLIDSDFRGDCNAVLFNQSQEPFEWNVGDRIAQLILEKHTHAQVVEVEDLDHAARGVSG
jgi:dUTP pyrophosphatase